MSERFYVAEMHGSHINVRAHAGAGPRSIPVAYYVHDSAYCHRALAQFPPTRYWFSAGVRSSKLMKAKAFALAARWNAEEDTGENEPALYDWQKSE